MYIRLSNKLYKRIKVKRLEIKINCKIKMKKTKI